MPAQNLHVHCLTVKCFHGEKDESWARDKATKDTLFHHKIVLLMMLPFPLQICKLENRGYIWKQWRAPNNAHTRNVNVQSESLISYLCIGFIVIQVSFQSLILLSQPLHGFLEGFPSFMQSHFVLSQSLWIIAQKYPIHMYKRKMRGKLECTMDC